MRFEFKLPCLPTSTNNLFIALKSGRRIKTRDYVVFENIVHAEILKTGLLSILKNYAGKPYKLELIAFKGTWRYKNGNPIKQDVSNFIKSAEDAVCRVTGWDDQFCQGVSAEKRVGSENTCRLIFEFFPASALL